MEAMEALRLMRIERDELVAALWRLVETSAAPRGGGEPARAFREAQLRATALLAQHHHATKVSA
jgi:hypothetical protein